MTGVNQLWINFSELKPAVRFWVAHNKINIFFKLKMPVPKEKLEEIYKVYDEKRNGQIPTQDISTDLIVKDS